MAPAPRERCSAEEVPTGGVEVNGSGDDEQDSDSDIDTSFLLVLEGINCSKRKSEVLGDELGDDATEREVCSLTWLYSSCASTCSRPSMIDGRARWAVTGRRRL